MTEDQLEQEALTRLGDVSHLQRYGLELASDGGAPKRGDYSFCSASPAIGQRAVAQLVKQPVSAILNITWSRSVLAHEIENSLPRLIFGQLCLSDNGQSGRVSQNSCRLMRPTWRATA